MRIIDADALLKSIESDRNCSDMPSQWIDGVNYAIDLIELYEPTIDIVRCKDCKYWVSDGGALMICDIHKDPTVPDHYCSYGEEDKDE